MAYLKALTMSGYVQHRKVGCAVEKELEASGRNLSWPSLSKAKYLPPETQKKISKTSVRRVVLRPDIRPQELMNKTHEY
jgi:hypothetical protein